MNRETCQSLAALSGSIFPSAIFLFSAFSKIIGWTKGPRGEPAMVG